MASGRAAKHDDRPLLFSDLFKSTAKEKVPEAKKTRERPQESHIPKRIQNVDVPKAKQFRNIELQMMLPHVFLPRRLPGKQSRRLPQHETNLLRLMADKIFETIQATGDGNSLLNTINLFRTWLDIQQSDSLDSRQISAAVEALKPGDSFALYIRAQNAGLMISRPRDDQFHNSTTAIFSTFPASSRSEDVMSTTGNLLITCPTTSIHIPITDLLKSDTLGRQLSALCSTQCEIAMPKTEKAGSSHVEIRDVADPTLISKLVSGLLTNEDSDFCSHFPKISKKVRDQVNWEEKSPLPFRRSGLWFTAKVVLHLSLVDGLGETDGTFLYKLILLSVIKYYIKTLTHSDADISMQIIAKVAHRLCKVESFLEHNDVSQQYVRVYQELRKSTLHLMKTVRTTLETRWNNVVKTDQHDVRLSLLKELNFKKNTKHVLKVSGSYFQRKKVQSQATQGLIRPPKCPPRHRVTEMETTVFPLSYFETTGEEDIGIVLSDFEQYVHTQLSSHVSVSNCQTVRNLLETYIKKAVTYYANDPVGGSQMVLCSLKIIQVLDQVVVRAQPLLKQHRSGVDVAIVKDLLLVKYEDMEVAHELESYFNDRNRNCQPALIEEEQVSTISFSALYASSNNEMRSIKEEILAEADRKIAEKKTEVQQARIRVADLEKRASEQSHSFKTETDEYGFKNEVHLSGCMKCSLENQAKNYKVQVYERPLPSDTSRQYAVVFELKIPQEIACLRDALYVFRRKVCSTRMSSSESPVNLWTKYNEISRYHTGKQEYVNLGSTTKLFKETNYGSLHPSSSDDHFIVNNGYNCRFVTESNCLKEPGNATVKAYCTFNIPSGSKYKSLEWAVRDTTHSQNEVLAQQITCPKDLSLSEFKEFGSLRAGHRIQLRNVYRALQQDSLSFHEEPVFSLVCQSIWQAGPQTSPGQIYREAHLDLVDENFATILLQLLEKVLNQQSKNWANYYTLLNIITITARSLSLAPTERVKTLALHLLLKCRNVANTWNAKVETVLKKSKDVSKQHTEKLRMNLIMINICSALTFWVDKMDIPSVMKDSEDIECWLKAIAKIKDNIILSTAGVDMLPTSLRNLLRWVRNTGVKMENRLHTLLRSNEDGFKTFAKHHFPGSQTGVMHTWRSCEGPEKQVYQSTFENDEKNEVTLHMDIIRGIFLVNGDPVGYLPSTITDHQDFQRVFCNVIFEVKPGVGGTLETSCQNCIYSFLLSNSNDLIVTEIRQKEDSKEEYSTYQLVSHHVFDKDIPFLLKENYSHWWDKAQNTVSFRPKNFLSSGFFTKVAYVLDLNSYQLKEMSTGKLFIDINSQSYKNVQKVMDRLEHHHHVHLLHCLDKSQTTVELPRMAIQFEIERNGQLNSREYPGLKVAAKQKFGTFVGLKQGLLLESIVSSTKSNPVLLIPHGNMKIEPGSNHQVVHIGLDTLRKPEFFALEVDERLHQLRAGQSHSGWLFLALLHAATASPIADPFTGLTGTEAALLLLQSAHCWSCQPIDAEANKILRAIAELSPRRTYYPDHLRCMEKVEWPEGLSSLAAHDGYQMIVKKLVDDSHRLAFLHKQPEPHQQIHFNNILVQKSYWRHHRLYTEQAQVSSEFDSQFQTFPAPIWPASFDANLDKDVMQAVRTMAHLGHSWTVELPEPSRDGHLKSLLLHGEELSGINNSPFYPTDATSIISLAFRESWLDLYNFARRVKTKHYECDWTVLLCVLAFTGTPLAHLQILHAIAVHPDKFRHQNPPPYSNYFEVGKHELQCNTLKTILHKHTTSLCEYIKRTNRERRFKEEKCDYELREREMQKEHNSLINSQLDEMMTLVKEQWPTKTIWLINRSRFTEINVQEALIPVNNNLATWYINRELKIFLEEVENTVFQCKNYPNKAHENTLTLCTNTSLKQYHQYRFTDLKLVRFLRNNELYDASAEDDHSDLEIAPAECDPATAAEMIFRTGQTHLWNFQVVSSEQCSTNEAIKPFPWKVDNSCRIGEEYMNDNKRSWDAYSQQAIKTPMVEKRKESLVQQLDKACSEYLKYGKYMWKKTTKRVLSLNQTFQVTVLRVAALFPRIMPCTILPLICNEEIDRRLRNFAGATAVIWTLEQKANRCLQYAKAGEGMEVVLNKELATSSVKNSWSPQEKPEWLLLELEMNFKIRPIQVKVANAMLKPEEEKHTVMQLNMGEGKTAVIIPLVVALLANGKELCRVTVLKSLFHMNREALMFKMGGLLNQRVYTFPCRRDILIDCDQVSTILQIYEECVAKRGVVLTLPEYQLSFQLKGYEQSRNGNFDVARPLLQVQDWLKSNVRDVLDESDAILNVKYQLVYTAGEQIPVCGESLRWQVAESLLKLVPARLFELKDKYGTKVAECGNITANPESFTPCRLLSLDRYTKLCEMLANDILDGKLLGVEFPDLLEDDVPLVFKFLSSAIITKDEHERGANMFNFDTNTRHCHVLLILRGLLACGVLALVLNKRWKVNYGVNPNGNRLMAVPFRAKDVAADRTEFGHPDVAILSTILSYYYSGLDNKQLDQCFELLYRQQNCEQEYANWISKVSPINPSIETLHGVNLADHGQRTRNLNPALLNNMAVIDFWLGKVVFPKESKQFGWKMLCSPWDLCAADAEHPVTGFSGTNDTKLLLPKNICQKDLPELLGTNGKVLHNLLRPENNTYACLSGASNMEILERLVKENIPLLLDVGALMTKYTNRAVAWKWLNLKHETPKNAALYFDKDDKLVVIDRRGKPCLFELSPYRERMNECVIYLDDFHTRGTDLKIPRGTKGCVTLGKGVTKDKLVQGCMRMRMLGEGHNVCFWASTEVNGEILRLTKNKSSKISVKDVLTWAMENSRLVTRDGMLHWVVAGCNYITKKTAHRLFDLSNKSDDEIRKLGERCSDKEITDLRMLYGTFCQEEYYAVIAECHLQKQLARFDDLNLDSSEARNFVDVKNYFSTTGRQIVQHCNHLVPKYKRLSHLLDEEQERELEQELEEEREVERPPPAKPIKSHLCNEVIKFVQDGIFNWNAVDSWCVKLPFALRKTKLWQHAQENCWGQNIYATKDFVKVVELDNQNDCIDQFIRPPTWIATLTKNNLTQFLLLSPHEVNELMPLLRSTKAAAVLHMYAARLHSDQDTLLQCPELAVPSSTVAVNYTNFNDLYANLSLFSGNMYFADEIEQDVFVNFVGFIPRPRTEEEKKVFNNRWTSNGFVKPEFRTHLPDITSRFQSNPEALVRGLIARRFDDFPSRCHVSSVIVSLRKPLTQGTVDLIPIQSIVTEKMTE